MYYHLDMNIKSTKNIAGQKFGNWEVLERKGTRVNGTTKSALWKVICKCGVIRVLDGRSLRNGSSKSCGCLRNQLTKKIRNLPCKEEHYNWKGGRSISKRGYISISVGLIRDLYPNAKWREGIKPKCMFEHQAVMSHHLNRSLYVGESVHHINGLKTDNRLENLELKTRFHGSGQSIEDMLSWAREIIRRYGP